MQKPTLIILVMLLISCTKYKVMSEVKENLYHLYNPKKQKTEIIQTKDSLTKGQFYRIREINIINSPYYSKKRFNKNK